MRSVTEPVRVRPSELIVPGYREGMTEYEFSLPGPHGMHTWIYRVFRMRDRLAAAVCAISVV